MYKIILESLKEHFQITPAYPRASRIVTLGDLKDLAHQIDMDCMDEAEKRHEWKHNRG